MTPFESFLQEIFMKHYCGLDDDAPEVYEHWLSELDTEDVIRYADDFANLKK